MPAPQTAHAPDHARFVRPPRAGRRARAGSVDDAARRLRDVLRNEVLGGAFPDGLLPREPELMLRYEARRAVVRGALAMLRDEGIVERVQGIGTFAVREERYVTWIEELHGESESDGVIPQARARVLDRSFAAAPEPVARKLQLTPGDTVLRLEYLALIDGEPFALATNYVAFPEAEALARTQFQHDWYTLLHDANVSFAETEWVLCAINADASVAGHLAVAPGTAVMLAEQLIWDDGGRPYDFAVCYVRSDRYAFASSSWSIGARSGRAPLVSSPVRGVRSDTAPGS